MKEQKENLIIDGKELFVKELEQDDSLDFFDVAEDSVLKGDLTKNGVQSRNLFEAINGFSKALNDSALKSNGLPVNTPSAQYKGFIAEEFYKITTKINALAEGVPDWKIGIYTKGELPDGTKLSGIDMETDISIWKRNNPWDKPFRAKDYQSKVHNNANDYIKDMRNEQYKKVDFVGAKGQGVNDKISIEVDGKIVSSDSATPQEFEKMADNAKAQKSAEYAKKNEKVNHLNKINVTNAIKVGALTGLIVSTAKEVISLIKNKDNISEEIFINSVKNLMCGTIEGGVRGGVIMKSVQLLGNITSKDITSNSMEAIPVMAMANLSVDFAKDLYKYFITKKIDADDLLCNTINNTYISFTGFAGSIATSNITSILISAKTSAATGAGIGSALGPIGTVVGSVVGGLLIGCCSKMIINEADKNAIENYNACINMINTNLTINGTEKTLYFIDEISSLSELKLSFKNLVPCFNILSDFKEYNLRKKALKNIENQLNNKIEQLDKNKEEKINEIKAYHQNRIKELNEQFRKQKVLIEDKCYNSVNEYLKDSYGQYLENASMIYDIVSDKEYMYEDNTAYNNVASIRSNKITIDNEIFNLFVEMKEQQISTDYINIFMNRINELINEKQIYFGKQYISYEQSKYLSMIN